MDHDEGDFLDLLRALQQHIAMAEHDRGESTGDHFWAFVSSIVESNSEQQVAYLLGWLCIALGSSQLYDEIGVYRRVLAERN